MGVDFSSLPLKDHTMGLIFEMDPQGILGTNERYFEKYIEDKTKFFISLSNPAAIWRSQIW